MMIQNKKVSAFMPMIENRGSYNAKQKVPDGSSSRMPQEHVLGILVPKKL